MLQSEITILREIEEQPKEYSLGFRRLLSLPKKVRRSFDLEENIKTINEKAFNGLKILVEVDLSFNNITKECRFKAEIF